MVRQFDNANRYSSFLPIDVKDVMARRRYEAGDFEPPRLFGTTLNAARNIELNSDVFKKAFELPKIGVILRNL